MKYKTTRKAIVAGCQNIRSAGYYDLADLLRNHEPVAYTCGIYGWNFDVFEVYGVTICTGYRNMPGKRLNGIRKYEKKSSCNLGELCHPIRNKKRRNRKIIARVLRVERRL